MQILCAPVGCGHPVEPGAEASPASEAVPGPVRGWPRCRCPALRESLAGTIPFDLETHTADIGTMVDPLQAAHAQHIVVWNTPNPGLAPAVASTGFGGTGSFLAGLMNVALATRSSGEADVSSFDLFGFGSQIAANPAACGLANVTDACGAVANVTDARGAVANANCGRYEYWDGIHPTNAAHQAIAGAMFAATVPVLEPETCALMAFGLVAVAWGARRRVKPAWVAKA